MDVRSPRRYGPSLIFPLLSLVAGLLLPPLLNAQTADDVINAYLKARGGLARIRAVQTERVTATITLEPSGEGALVYERKRPFKMHMEIIVNGQSFLRIYDGKSAGWIYNPFLPDPSVQPMTAGEIRGINEESDLDGPFVDYKAKGNQIEFVGKTEVEGKPAYRLKLTAKTGEVSNFLFDASSGLLLKWEGTHKAKDRTTGKDVDIPWQSFFRDFRDVDGLQYPFLVESGAVDGSQVQKITTSKIEVNVPIADSHFSEPNPPVSPAAPAGIPPSSN